MSTETMMPSTEEKLSMDLDDIVNARKAKEGPPKRNEEEVVRVSRRIYVSNLAWSTSWQDLKDFFRQAGNVVYASVMSEDGRSKGCGIVEFETSEEAVKAIETLHDAELDGRRVSVREDREDRDLKANASAAAPGQQQRVPRGSVSSKRTREQPHPAADGAGRRVFVNNLAWSTSWQDLKQFFRQAGNVVYASVMSDEETGRSKGCGIVEFETAREALVAIETLHDAELDGRKVAVREDREKGGSHVSKQQRSNAGNNNGGNEIVRVGRRIYVGNLAWTTSWQDLKDFFRQAGNVVYASVMNEDGRSKGCGIVEFETSEEAVKAIETMHDVELDGRKVTVREDREDRDLKSSNYAAGGGGRYPPSRNKRVRSANRF